MKRDSIIVRVKDLQALVQEVQKSGVQYVNFTISDSEKLNGEVFPAQLALLTCDPSSSVHFTPIYAPENEAELRAAMLARTYNDLNSI